MQASDNQAVPQRNSSLKRKAKKNSTRDDKRDAEFEKVELKYKVLLVKRSMENGKSAKHSYWFR